VLLQVGVVRFENFGVKQMEKQSVMPGFTAEQVFELDRFGQTYIGSSTKRVSNRMVVTPQRSEFACGLGFAGIVGGIFLANPFAVLGGLGAVVTNC
jgi:hypothetical protein